MKKALLPLTLFAFTFSLFSLSAQTINTFAGNGSFGYSGDGGPATAAELNLTFGIIADPLGNIYIADNTNHRTRQVTGGIMETIAGTGVSGFSGDGGQATAAELSNPADVAVDASGNIFIVDFTTERVREINTNGIISTIAGNGTAGFSGDGGQATAAEISNACGVSFDGSGNLYISDRGNNRIRMVNTSGIISTYAGNGTGGYSGDGGPATAAELRGQNGIQFDQATGNLYIADYQNNAVRMVNSSGIISTVAGNGTGGYSGDGGQATAAQIANPMGVAIDPAGNLYLADHSNNRVRLVNTSGIITTFAGTGSASFSGDGGPASAAAISSPTGVCLDATGNLYISDAGNARIRIVTGIPTGISQPATALENVSVYPNPSNGIFNVQSSAVSQKSSAEIFDLLGNKVYQSFLISNSQFLINLGNQPDGIYIYRILNESGDLIAKGRLAVVR